MTATATEQAIAKMLKGYIKAALAEETETQRMLAAVITEGGKYPLSTYMERALVAEADAAPWHYANLAIDHYRGLDETDEATPEHIIKGVRAAYEQHLHTLVKSNPTYTSNAMSNLVTSYQREGLRKFVANVSPLLDQLDK